VKVESEIGKPVRARADGGWKANLNWKL